MASTDHIAGENQSLDTYMEVLKTRAEAFKAWVLKSVLDDAKADECDWDAAYAHWLSNVEQSLDDSTLTFLGYVRAQ